jgi:hypothetical protein
MKAERRHELKTNSLARGIEHLPDASRQYGTKVMVALLLALLVVFFIRQRITSGRAREASAAQALNAARGAIGEVDEVVNLAMFNPFMQGMLSPANLAQLRQQVATRGEEGVRSVLETADDPRLIAEAKLARGDLNWKLANFPDLPGAATQPALQFPRSKKDLLETALQSYQEVLDDPGSPRETMWTARFGLAAVRENQGEWDKAKEQYQNLVNDLNVPQPLKDQAVERLNKLDERRRPVLLGAPQAAEDPARAINPTTSTAPSTTQSSTSPASKPASAPSSAPASAPTSGPAPAPTSAAPAPAQPVPPTPSPAPKQ